MAQPNKFTCSAAMALLMASTALPAVAQEVGTADQPIVLDTIVLSAEEQVKQALGASTIAAEDIEKQPVTNDISEIVRKMPGVNLTGATATGQRGNQRQIDIRGMGPENTLILIDGKPVLSRNSVKMSRGGERDTRGDSNWVPAELIERIEVIRGPAAARYGSGASGGVVNIITKRPTEFMGQVGVHLEFPENNKEGETKRTNFMLAGPIAENLTFRVFGNYNETEGDAPDLNPEVPYEFRGEESTRTLAGTEGVTNKDFGALLTWDINAEHAIDFEGSFSRQGNEYAGDSRNGAIQETVGDDVNLIGEETNRMYRRTLAVTHRGQYDFGESNSYLQWENTRNSRLCSGTAGSVEDNITNCVDTDGDGENDATAFTTIELDNISAKTEWIMPFDVMSRPGRATLGADYRGEFMDDASSIRGGLDESLASQVGVEADGTERDPESDQYTVGLYAEANIEWNDKLTLTPALRYDYNDNFGSNWSPSLNASYQFNDEWSMKVGIARAFKTPNLYQLNPNYVYVTRGNGCPFIDGERLSGPCYVLGNQDLEPEKSINKEIGVAYQGYNNVNASLTYFHNDYDNRIGSGFYQYNEGATTNRLYRWENQENAVISGLEGNFSTDLGQNFAFNANFTKMIKSEQDNGEPLSLVPDYTINASLDWFVTDAMTFTLSATHYGEIEAATVSSTTNEDFTDTTNRDAYTLVNLGMNWDINDTANMSLGVSNLFDKTIVRTDSGSGANTFNEPGRAFYLSLNQSF
ncbi:FepA family TonB-dependent siderophore receptor [Paracoccus aerodenitrificans]|uniref:FepA family TonB-dependent siderophore receptor n=1 Tax=Paracoccus aerodenitrificans TaxID=3017781 RepID=UPI0022F1024F|nr:FepA family TonB-dependent siderophore receptor [Paracoccus aerodenitrificans]